MVCLFGNGGDSPWFNNQAYVDTLNPQAIQRFIEVTHEKYFDALGGEFGGSVPAIFTDEPQFTRKTLLNFAESGDDCILPFTDDFEETFTNAYGESLLDKLPEVFWELPNGKVSQTRYRYHDHACERFVSAYADTIGHWCGEHGIMLTGHMMSEDSLEGQTIFTGDVMRAYRSFQLQGIDMLCDRREFTTAKQAQSASRQFGREGIISELYGVTNWDFDFRGHKLQGDWQAVLGVTVRIHHLTWLSMEGEAKRDYPASIGYQSPWYREYAHVEDHFARFNTALTRGKPSVRVGVIHPIESYWLHFGPNEQTGALRKEMESAFKSLTEWLLFGLIDFDFIAESLLPELSPVRNEPKFTVGESVYDVIVVPNCETLRGTTVERLAAFAVAGGKVVFAGEPATYVDAAESVAVKELSGKCDIVSFAENRLLSALEPYREVDIRHGNGARVDGLIYQVRHDGADKWLFIAHAKKSANPDVVSQEDITIIIKGEWNQTLFDTLMGEIYSIGGTIKGGNTIIPYSFYCHDSVLINLKRGKAERYYCWIWPHTLLTAATGRKRKKFCA